MSEKSCKNCGNTACPIQRNEWPDTHPCDHFKYWKPRPSVSQDGDRDG